MRPSRVLTLTMMALALAGCVRKGPRVAANAPLPPPPITVAPARAAVAPVRLAPVAYSAAALVPAPEPLYRLDSGDRLRVVVFGQEGLTNTYSVDANGSVTMPLIGAVRARGMTAGALSQAIAARLRQGFIREPHVAVEIEAYRPFFILGEVINPGQYAYVPNMTVETAVAIAGGFSPRAWKRTIKVTRNFDGVIVREKIPLIHPVRPGDTINVAERWF